MNTYTHSLVLTIITRHFIFRLYSANSKTYVGSGKVQDIMAAVNATGECSVRSSGEESEGEERRVVGK